MRMSTLSRGGPVKASAREHRIVAGPLYSQLCVDLMCAIKRFYVNERT